MEVIFYLIHQDKFHLDFISKCEKWIITNILEDTLRECFPKLKVQKNFSNGKKNALIIKEKIYKMDYIKTKTSFYPKLLLREQRATHWEMHMTKGSKANP